MKADEIAGDTRTSPTPSHLVLFAGLGTQPDREVSELLSRAGMRSLWLGHPARAFAASAHARFDAAVLAIDEPMSIAARHFDAWRRMLRCPLLVLAQGDDEVDEIIALELGADAVLPRGVTPRRLRAHLLTLTRMPAADERSLSALQPAPAPAASHADGWSLDRVMNRLERGERRVELTEAQAALLQVLIDDAPRVVPRARLLAAIAHGRELNARSVDVYIARLRARLREQRVDEMQITGVRGRGYALSRMHAHTPQPLQALRLWHAGAGAGDNHHDTHEQPAAPVLS